LRLVEKECSTHREIQHASSGKMICVMETFRQRNPGREFIVRQTNERPGVTFFYGWWVVFACAVGLFWGPPVNVFCFPVFLKPIMNDFHVGRATVSLGFTLGLITTAVGAPLVGWLLDRYGSRIVILVATSMFASILLLNNLLATNLSRFYLFNIALGLVANGVGPVPYGKVVSLWFDKHRGLALGLMMIGIGSGAMILPPVAQRLIARFGWHTAYAMLGTAVLLIAVPVVASLLRDRPQLLGLLPDGVRSKGTSDGGEGTPPGLSAQDAWRTKTFWLMVCAFFLVSASVQGCVIHLAAMLSDRGISFQTAALGSSLAGAAVLLGRVGTGYLLDRFFAPRVAAVFFSIAAVGIGLLWMGSTLAMFVGALFVGSGLGAELNLIAYLISRYFGLRSFGKIFSYAFAAFALAGALGPLIMGAGFDATGSYRGCLASFFVATLIAAALMTRLGPYCYRSGAPATVLE
jgi:MFS family permease